MTTTMPKTIKNICMRVIEILFNASIRFCKKLKADEILAKIVRTSPGSLAEEKLSDSFCSINTLYYTTLPFTLTLLRVDII